MTDSAVTLLAGAYGVNAFAVSLAGAADALADDVIKKSDDYCELLLTFY